jgi:hypothetical protein
LEREAQLSDPSVYGDPASSLLEGHDKLLHAYEAAGGTTLENRGSTLRDLGSAMTPSTSPSPH